MHSTNSRVFAICSLRNCFDYHCDHNLNFFFKNKNINFFSFLYIFSITAIFGKKYGLHTDYLTLLVFSNLRCFDYFFIESTIF